MKIHQSQVTYKYHNLDQKVTSSIECKFALKTQPTTQNNITYNFKLYFQNLTHVEILLCVLRYLYY